ncbi:MAG TPA: Flp family type IVb pilin [Acidimicrobiia bacterium]|nr:Flp family type IVb pilin [Acidimicrobiia bacterium]
MNRIRAKLSTWVSDPGASMVEYALLVVLIAIIAIVAVAIAGEEVSMAFRSIANTLRN